jgi:hypothetical protein
MAHAVIDGRGTQEGMERCERFESSAEGMRSFESEGSLPTGEAGATATSASRGGAADPGAGNQSGSSSDAGFMNSVERGHRAVPRSPLHSTLKEVGRYARYARALRRHDDPDWM